MRRGQSRGLMLLAAVGLIACGSSGMLETARHGNLSALQREVAEAQRRGDLDEDSVHELATVIAGREVRSATGPAAVARIRAIRTCAPSILPVLRERASRSDDIGAEATLILLELGKLSERSLYEKHREASSGAWRAVAARAAVAPPQGVARRAWFQDPDERVRRAALAAAAIARDPADVEPLLEAARLDPDPLSRSQALRSVGAIGGTRAVLALDDLWARSDETARVSIVDAWAMPAAFRTGGRDRLVRVVETSRGIAALSAAEALSRQSGKDKELGVATLLRAISDGTVEERSLAMRLAPLGDPDVKKALEKASKDGDPEARVIALARLLEVDANHAAARSALRELAKKTDDVAIQARAALAAAGDRGIIPSLAQQLVSERSFDRQSAAFGLIRLGEWPRVATALADDDPLVRTTVACRVLGHGKG